MAVLQEDTHPEAKLGEVRPIEPWDMRTQMGEDIKLEEVPLLELAQCFWKTLRPSY
jgi:hypothetical protein